MIRLDGRTALVTGGSRGIGAACCAALARAGAAVAVNYRADAAAARRVADAIAAAGGRAEAIQGDVSARADAEGLVAETVARLGGLDIVVNNAGIWKGAAVDRMTDEEWSEMLAVNLTGPFFVTRAAVPHLKRSRHGRIVYVSSTAGQRGEAFHSHYAATKGALISLTKSLAVELAPHGITVNCVAPGWTRTEMAAAALDGPDRAKILATIPLGRAGTADEMAGAVTFLASDLASFVNGEILNVNGGAVLVG